MLSLGEVRILGLKAIAINFPNQSVTTGVTVLYGVFVIRSLYVYLTRRLTVTPVTREQQFDTSRKTAGSRHPLMDPLSQD